MEVYGLTGGIGSGKSTVAAMLEEYGIPVVSADELSRMVVAPGSPGLADVVEAFGPEVLDERGELDRKKMGKIVFATPERRRQLEAILHPRIRERYEQVLDALEKAGHPVMVYEVPLLFEKQLDQQDEMKAVILVTATADTRIARVKDRDALTTDDVLARMRTQMPEQDKRERADYVVHNDGDLDDLRREVEYLLSRFLRLPPRADHHARLDQLDQLGQLDTNAVDPLEVAEEVAEEVVEEIEAELELEIDELEIDTLSPEEVDTLSPDEVAEQPTAPIDVPATTPAAPSPAPVDHLELSVTSEHAPGYTPRDPPSAGSPPQLEVELQPTTPLPGAHRSGSAWIPAGSSPPVSAPSASPGIAVVPIVAPPPQIPAPATPKGQDAQTGTRASRPRSATIPQLSAPDVTQALGQQLDSDEDPT
jgi:dephospho-CoA kinase